MTYRQSDSATIQEEILNTIRLDISALAQQLNNIIEECYNDELSENATMQIGR